MASVHFSLKALAGFIVFLLVFGLLFSIDRGSGPISRAWPVLMPVFVLGGSFAIYRRMWRERENPDQVRRAGAQGLYGVLPQNWQRWLFP
jgi:hypothetical protein